MMREEVEMCSNCMGENIIQWDVEKDGYEVKCQHCGEKIMLCDACFHSDDNEVHKCDWHEDKGCWRKRNQRYIRYPEIDRCSDKQYLYDNLTHFVLSWIEKILEFYNSGKIDLLIPRFDNDEIDFDGEWKLIIKNKSYKANGNEVLVLKWYEGFEDTGYLVGCLSSLEFERYFYSIEKDEYNGKVIHLSGNLYENDAQADTQDYFRLAEWTFLYIQINEAKEMIKNNTFYDYVDEKIDYLSNLTESEAINICEHYHNGQSGTELHINEITDDTPCGNYWF